MNIGIDLDNVLISYPPFIPDKLIDKLYKKKSNGVLVYKIPSFPEQVFRKATHISFLRPPIKKNLEFIKSIPKDKNKLYLISSRFKFLKKNTERLTKKYGLDKIFDGLYFNYDNEQPHLFKDRIIKQLGIDIYIDDDIHLLKYAAKQNKKTMFFWLNHYSKTNKKDTLTRNIFSVSDLTDIFN